MLLPALPGSSHIPILVTFYFPHQQNNRFPKFLPDPCGPVPPPPLVAALSVRNQRSFFINRLPCSLALAFVFCRVLDTCPAWGHANSFCRAHLYTNVALPLPSPSHSVPIHAVPVIAERNWPEFLRCHTGKFISKSPLSLQRIMFPRLALQHPCFFFE